MLRALLAALVVGYLPGALFFRIPVDNRALRAALTAEERAFWAVLPAPILWGASFPLALASVARRGEDPGRLVGGVYAANTVGAIFGSVVASLILVSPPATMPAGNSSEPRLELIPDPGASPCV